MKYDSQKINKWLRENYPTLTWKYWTELDKGFVKLEELCNINLEEFKL